MRNIYPAPALLRKIAKCRELTLHDVVEYLHLKNITCNDFYTLAALIREGYIVSNSSADYSACETNEIARQLYAMWLDKGMIVEDVIGTITGIGWKNKLILGCGVKTFIYLSESREKKVNWLVSLIIGIVIAVTASVATSFMQDKLTHNNCLQSDAATPRT